MAELMDGEDGWGGVGGLEICFEVVGCLDMTRAFWRWMVETCFFLVLYFCRP